MSRIQMLKSILLLAEQLADMIMITIIKNQLHLPRRLQQLAASKRGEELMSPLIKWILAGLLGGVLIYIAGRALYAGRGEETAQQLADALKGQQEPLT